MIQQPKQKTIKNSISYQGIGLHKGQPVKLVFRPAPPDTGIVFIRTDLPDNPAIPAQVEWVIDTTRGTTLGKDQIEIHTVEHVLAAVAGSGITNLLIEIDSIEPPAADGSTRPFLEILQRAGLVEQEQACRTLVLKKAIRIREQDKFIVALPADCFQLSFTLVYDHPAIKTQFAEYTIEPATFAEEIAGARTFGFLKEVERLKSMGLALGGSLDNAIVLGDKGPLNPLRFPDEFVRHKILDLVGDLALIGQPLQAHIIAVKSGHSLNTRLAKIIKQEGRQDDSLC